MTNVNSAELIALFNTVIGTQHTTLNQIIKDGKSIALLAGSLGVIGQTLNQVVKAVAAKSGCKSHALFAELFAIAHANITDNTKALYCKSLSSADAELFCT